ncbi:MAG TPA: glycoside hydrolase family 16 protein [Candidatus Limnocylindrales bacterium]|nr:glycoside hydrolase family 16 protein [Candidatus Limnocylindrales bacterium]
MTESRGAVHGGDVLDRSAFEVLVEDDFDEPALRSDVWLPYYLPQWSSRAQSAARFQIDDSCLRLRIGRDQRPWAPPDVDGWTRVSSLQTAVASGDVGSATGQHRFRAGLTVREEQPTIRLCTPARALVEARLRTTDDPASMAALWLIGVEDEPAHAAEICVAEIFGRDIAADRTTIGMGLHPFGDGAIRDDFARRTLPIDATEFHVYSADWTADGVRFFVDDRLVAVSDQSPAYPMQVMLGIYEFADGADPPSPADAYPKELVVDWFRVSQRRR